VLSCCLQTAQVNATVREERSTQLELTPPLARLLRYVVYVAKFLASDDGVTMARLVTGIHDDKKLQEVFWRGM